MIGSTIIFSVGGVLLGLERFILEAKKEGSWKVNWPKALFLGLPLFYLAFGIFVGYLPINFIKEGLFYPSMLLFSEINMVPAFQMTFGYILVTSFIKIKTL